MESALITAFLRGEFDSEERAGFSRLGRIPDTTVRRFLHYYRRLSKSDAELLKSALAKSASPLFTRADYPVRLTHEESLALEQKARAFTLMGDWQFMALKNLKLAVGMSRSQNPAMKGQMQGFHIPEDVLAWADGLTTCKAPELRKLVKHAFAARFGFEAVHVGGGNWHYGRADGEGPCEVAIDYGGRSGQQLRYSVYLAKRRPSDPPSQTCFESALGAGFGDWDFITEATAAQDIALLTDLVDYVAGIPGRLAQKGPQSTEP